MVGELVSSSYSRHLIYFLVFISLAGTQNIVVFQPSFLITTGPTVTGLLFGNTSDITLHVRTVSPSNTTGSIGPSSCKAEVTRWALTTQQVEKTTLRVQLRLNTSLRLCGVNETEADCCPQPLCVLETLQVSACVGDSPQASLLIQAKIYAFLSPTNTGSDNKTIIPNQVYQPLGSCPCDLTLRECDIRCCCDKDCSSEDLKLFEHHCLPGPFGGQVSPEPDYQCSVQKSENAPDWFPFLCVTSPLENNPYLGLFYQGEKIKPKPGPSFQRPMLSAPVPVNTYRQGSPILTWSDQYFTIPQIALGRCINNAPVAFLENFKVECETLLQSCPTGPPLQNLPADLSIQVKDGQGGDVTVNVTEEAVVDLSPFIADTVAPSNVGQVCENVTLALDYKFYWKGNGITNITLTHSVGTVPLNDRRVLKTRYSAVFLNGDFMGEPNSGNPGYQVGKPVIAGIANTSENGTDIVQRASVYLWKPVGYGLCSTAERKPVLFGENSTSGCLLPLGLQNLTQCDLLRETISSLQDTLIRATYVARSGNPDSLIMADWLNISFVNASTPMEDMNSLCSEIPSHLHIYVWSLVTGMIEGQPQRNIHDFQVSYSLSSWALECEGGDTSPCVDPTKTQMFPITSSVTFIDIPVNTGSPKTRFQINFTEYECSRNDICWPELAFPITRYYTGEPYSQSLAKGLILVFFFIAASVLGTPWRQIWQAWKGTSL
ncbi:tectonic-2 [Aulostomus maculatus]